MNNEKNEIGNFKEPNASNIATMGLEIVNNVTAMENDDDDSDSPLCDLGPPAIGIDLGTTNSCVAVYQDNGKIAIIPDPLTGKLTVPSCIAFSNNVCLVGAAATAQINTNPMNTIFDSKRLIGRKFSDPSVQNDLVNWPFQIVADVCDRPLFQLRQGQQPIVLTPIQVAALILQRLKEAAEKFLKRKVTDAVITVPANFTHSQRQATVEAGKIAGLNVLRTINEPTAAAMCLGREILSRENKQIGENSTVCIYDLGGGTFDVTVLKFRGKSRAIQVLSTAGDPHLGGEDFDNLLVNHVLEQIRAQTKATEMADLVVRNVRSACILLKHQLSCDEDAKITINNSVTKITRSQFEKMNASLFEKTIDLMRKAINDAKVKDKHLKIDKIVMIGGSSKIPKIEELLKNAFDGIEILKVSNPDTIVANGAAVQAAILNGDLTDNKLRMLLFDVTPLSLGVRTSGGLMNVIISRGTKVSAENVKVYTKKFDDQTSIEIKVYEGENRMVVDNNLLGSFTLQDIPEGSCYECRILVTFTVDRSGLLTVSAESHRGNNKQTLVIKHNTGRLSEDEIQKMIASNEAVLSGNRESTY